MTHVFANRINIKHKSNIFYMLKEAKTPTDVSIFNFVGLFNFCYSIIKILYGNPEIMQYDIQYVIHHANLKTCI